MADTANDMRLYNCGGAAYYQYFAGAIAGYIVSIVYLVVSVYWVSPFLMGELSYDHQKQQALCGRNGCGCRNNKLHYCDGGFYCVRKCVF